MRLWRLSGARHAESFDGGYGLLHNGRWNSVGRAVTYCATSPSLCVLEKLVHIEDPTLLPEMVMVRYEAPDDLGMEVVAIEMLEPDWRDDEAATQSQGDAWHASRSTPLLQVPSAVVPLRDSPDMNVVINHSHPAAARISLVESEPFALDLRLIRSRPKP